MFCLLKHFVFLSGSRMDTSHRLVSYLTRPSDDRCLLWDVAISREPAMSPAHDPPYGADRRHREPIDPSVITAIQVVAAWLIAFACVALITLLP
jgi:hypothetical protein